MTNCITRIARADYNCSLCNMPILKGNKYKDYETKDKMGNGWYIEHKRTHCTCPFVLTESEPVTFNRIEKEWLIGKGTKGLLTKDFVHDKYHWRPYVWNADGNLLKPEDVIC